MADNFRHCRSNSQKIAMYVIGPYIWETQDPYQNCLIYRKVHIASTEQCSGLYSKTLLLKIARKHSYKCTPLYCTEHSHIAF